MATAGAAYSQGEQNVVLDRTALTAPREAWPIFWSAVWVGALTALVVALIIGLIGLAVGAHQSGPAQRIVTYHDLRFWAMAFSIAGAFFSFVAGGWVAGKIAGFRQAEPAMLHGAIVWLVAVPLLVAFMVLGASAFGGWYGGLVGTPAWAVTQPAPATSPTAPVVVDPRTAAAARNQALTALTGLVLGLAGGVIGGGMASGEPMSLTYYRTRRQLAEGHVRTSEASAPTAPTAPTAPAMPPGA